MKGLAGYARSSAQVSAETLESSAQVIPAFLPLPFNILSPRSHYGCSSLCTLSSSSARLMLGEELAFVLDRGQRRSERGEHPPQEPACHVEGLLRCQARFATSQGHAR